MQAMILAAGFGTRLLPHTQLRPKPLFPILNQPLLLLTIARLRRHGFRRIVVNCHHLFEQIEAAVAGIPEVVVQREETILGTGGGLRKALDHIDDGPLLVTNGDIYHTINYRELYEIHRQERHRVTLALHDYPRFNNVFCEGERVTGFAGQASGGALAYTGVQVIDPQIVQDLPKGSFSCIIAHYREIIAAGCVINARRIDDAFWTDMGTEADYLALHGGLLSGTIPRWQEMAMGGPFLMGQDVHLDRDCQLDDWACIGEKTALQNCRLVRTVVWSGLKLRDQVLHDRLVSTDEGMP